MKLTKYEHACVVFEKDGTSLAVDPGSFSADAAAIIAGAEAILLTHEHYDHVHAEAISAALKDRPQLRVYGPAGLAGTFAEFESQYSPVAAGDELSVAGFSVSVHGALHAVIHPDIPAIANVGYLVDGSVYHPGDAYVVPEAEVPTLLLPTSGPWMKIGEAVDYVRAVRPRQVIRIHDLLLSDIGLQLAATLVGSLTGLALTEVPIGDSLSA